MGDRGSYINERSRDQPTNQATRPSTKVARKSVTTTTTIESAFQNLKLAEATGKWGSNVILHRRTGEEDKQGWQNTWTKRAETRRNVTRRDETVAVLWRGASGERAGGRAKGCAQVNQQTLTQYSDTHVGFQCTHNWDLQRRK